MKSTIEEKASELLELLEKRDKENFTYPVFEKVVLLAVEYLSLEDSLYSASRTSEIINEFEDICYEVCKEE